MYGNHDVLELLLQNWVPVLVIGAGVLLPICAVVARMFQQSIETWRQSRVDMHKAAAEQESLRMKQSMIDRGMGAAEIERVFRAGSDTPSV